MQNRGEARWSKSERRGGCFLLNGKHGAGRVITLPTRVGMALIGTGSRPEYFFMTYESVPEADLRTAEA